MKDITVKNLDIWYDKFHALKNVSIEIPEKQITALIGPSGCGKSTFIKSINRMIDYVPKARTKGEVLFNNKNVLSDDVDTIKLRRKIGMVFQNPTPFPKSIFENIAYGIEVQDIAKRQDKGLKSFFRKRKNTASRILESKDPLEVRIRESLMEAALWDEVKDRLDQSAYRLSGGQQQRLCIARSIAVRPKVMLFDEPCSELDPISTHKIEQLLMNLKEKYTVVIVTHNMNQAKRLSDQVAFFHLGKLVECGPTQEIFSNPKKQLTKDYITGSFG